MGAFILLLSVELLHAVVCNIMLQCRLVVDVSIILLPCAFVGHRNVAKVARRCANFQIWLATSAVCVGASLDRCLTVYALHCIATRSWLPSC